MGEVAVTVSFVIGVTVLLASCCNVVGVMVFAVGTCDVVVSFLMDSDDWAFIKLDDSWPAEDGGNPIVEFGEDNDEFHDAVKELDENGVVELADPEVLGLGKMTV